MTTSLFLGIYICTMFTLHPIEEVWNYLNPRPWPHKEYILVNWHVNDFKEVSKHKYVLLKYNICDYPLKAKARDYYWEKHF